MAFRQTNVLLGCMNGIARIDVSTQTYPGRIALIDIEDVAYVVDGNGRWSAHPSGRRTSLTKFYVHRRDCRTGITVSLHVHIAGKSGKMVDHRDGDGLNNARRNLRKVTADQNGKHSNGNHRATSRFKGVWFDRTRDKWAAAIRSDGVNYVLGRFKSERTAAKAYDSKAGILHGEFAVLNFPKNKVKLKRG